MTRAYVALGSNIEPERNIEAALKRLAARERVVAVSCFYRSPALGRPEQADYLNGVVALETVRTPRVLKLEVLRPLELELGRIRSEDRYAARPIDLDLIVYGDWTVEEPGLRIPDGDVLERAFLAVPLLQLAPDLIWPGSGRPLQELVAHFDERELTPAGAFSSHLEERHIQ